MRGYFLGEVQAFVDASQSGEHILERHAPRRGHAVRRAARPGQPGLGARHRADPAQKAVLDRLTALMTLLEGHAEFVMDGVGPEVIPSVEQIRARFNQRRESGNPLEKAIRRLLGVEVKMRQYAEGRKFVHGVVERVGMAGFNKIFELAADPAPARRAGRPGRLGGPGARAGSRDPGRRLTGAVARLAPSVAAVRRAVRPALPARPVAGAGGVLRRCRLAGAGRRGRVRGAAGRHRPGW